MSASATPEEPAGSKSRGLPPSTPSEDSHLTASSSFLDIPSFVVTSSQTTTADVWAVLQSVASQKSKASLLLLALSATVVNHARRSFLYGSPWAGFFALRPDFADDWRLVLSRPDIYLYTVLEEVSFQKLATFLISHALWGHAVSALGQFILTRPAETAAPAQQMAAVTYAVWLLSSIESSLAQSSTDVAIVWSAMSLVQTSPSLLMRILTKQRLGVSILAYPLACFVVAGLAPTAVGAVRSSARGRPGVLLTILGIVGSLYMLLAYRSRLYIAIETSGLFVFLGTFAVSATLLLRAQRSAGKEKKNE